MILGVLKNVQRDNENNENYIRNKLVKVLKKWSCYRNNITLFDAFYPSLILGFNR